MPPQARVCPACVTPLPSDAAFCYKCGTSTPLEIDASTGTIVESELSGVEEAARKAKLQSALGDSCEVRRLLGRGGFAEVYVAYDKRLKREIAVKTIRGDLVVNDMLIERFQREAEAVAKLRHPNIVPIYAVGEGEGLAYFTMPLIEGASLADVLEREGTIAIPESCRILREAANALHAAHRTGLVHRDIKPENVMLEGPERAAIVMDFGIAKTDASESKGLTGTGMLVGTPQYMSPEQAVGDRTLDARSDQYSLAMVGYRMLTGRLPFEGDSIQTLIFKTVTEVPAPAFEVAPNVPKDVSDVIAKALSKRPEDRYESMAAFAAAIGNASAADDDARPARPGRRAVKPDMASRVRSAMQAMPTWRHPLVWFAVLAFGVGLTLELQMRSDAGTALAANRSEAAFAARAFLRGRGVPAPSGAFPTFEKRETSLAFLQRTVGIDSTERRGAADIPLWRWTVKFGPAAAGIWAVDVGPESRIVGFRHDIADTATGVSISHDSARVLAEREIVARGWTMAALEPVRDSTITRKRRVDHEFRWRKKADPIQWRGKDSAYVEVRTTVAGPSVAAYATALHTPEAYDATVATKPVVKALTGVGWTVAILLLAVAFGLGTTRQRVDDLQWRTAFRVLGVAAIMLLIAGVPMFLENVFLSADSSGFLVGFLIGCVFAAIAATAELFMAVVGESLATESHPSAVVGLDAIARGRPLPPEIVPGIVWGYIFSAMWVAASMLLRFVASRAFHFAGIAGSVSGALTAKWPTTYGLLLYATGIVGSFAVLYAVMLFYSWKLPSLVARCLPALIFAAMMSFMGNIEPVAGAVQLLVAAFVLWRYGILASALSFCAADVLSNGVALVASGSSELLTAGIITLALGLAPLGIAFLAYSKWNARPA